MKPPFLDKQTKAKKVIRSRRPNKSAKSSRTAKKPSTARRRLRADTSPSPDPDKPAFFAKLLKFTSIILILMLAAGTLLYIKRDQWGVTSIIRKHFYQEPEHQPDPGKYALLTAQLDHERNELKARYLSAATTEDQQNILREACVLLEKNLPDMMCCWLGHPWDFNGTATIPGEGKIACGYFVSVIMRDAGFKINRIRVAQQPSQNIIRTFVENSKFYEVKTNTPYEQYVNEINEKYEGIQIVGLDKHVAFIVIKDGKMRFIHSGGLQRRVVDEAREDAYALEHSNYRVISNISRNSHVLKKWILGETFATVQ